MNNANPLWKILLLGAVIFIGGLLALPNIFGSDLAVQISGRANPLDSDQLFIAKSTIVEGEFEDVEFREEDDRLIALFNNQDDQLKAQDSVRRKIEKWIWKRPSSQLKSGMSAIGKEWFVKQT